MDQVVSFISNLANTAVGAPKLSIQLDCTSHRKTVTYNHSRNSVTLPLYQDQDSISGKVEVTLRQRERYAHKGIKVFLIGMLQIYSDSSLTTQFSSRSKELQPAGYIPQDKSYAFNFSNFQKDYQSFRGYSGRVRYFLRAQLNRQLTLPITQQMQFAVHTFNLKSLDIKPILTDMVIDNTIGVQICLSKNAYHLKEWIQGSVVFKKVNVEVVSMELIIMRRETLGTPDSSMHKSKSLATFQLLDGCPQQQDQIPFRMGLGGVKNLTPSLPNVHNRLFVRHWIMIRILDERGRQYIKKIEVTFYRK